MKANDGLTFTEHHHKNIIVVAVDKDKTTVFSGKACFFLLFFNPDSIDAWGG